MTVGLRLIQQWNDWLNHDGAHVLEAEKEFLPSLLSNYWGKHALLIGVPHQDDLLESTMQPHHMILGPLTDKKNGIRYIESALHELPVASASINLVLLPHTLEYLDNPRKLLTEACRIVKPEGYIVILGFNPFSLWGLRKKITHHKSVPWSNNFISANQIKKWLKLADFELVKQDTIFFRPPIAHHDTLYRKLKFMEWLGHKCWMPWGGIYILMAKAKVIPMTPIKLHWQQKLTGAGIPTMPRHSIRNLR